MLVKEFNVDPNCRDKDGMPPLLAAAGNNYVDTVRVLLEECRADVSLADEDGNARCSLLTCLEVDGGGRSDCCSLGGERRQL